MKLTHDWKRIVRKAYSIRLMLLAGVFSGAEIILPLYSDVLPQGFFSVMSFFAVAGAFVTRLLAQKEFHNGDK